MARRKRVTRRFPLDSPNWTPIVNAHQSLCGLTGNRQLAAKDLTNALADRDVPSMRRCFLPEWRSPPVGAVLLEPDGELLPAAYWTEHQVVVQGWLWTPPLSQIAASCPWRSRDMPTSCGNRRSQRFGPPPLRLQQRRQRRAFAAPTTNGNTRDLPPR